ncbi:MAG: hypothetical protein KDK29_17250, partial [Sedimentitalea sp.]|nr:hypothetical protein [Sedimentitalea sp.]
MTGAALIDVIVQVPGHARAAEAARRYNPGSPSASNEVSCKTTFRPPVSYSTISRRIANRSFASVSVILLYSEAAPGALPGSHEKSRAAGSVRQLSIFLGGHLLRSVSMWTWPRNPGRARVASGCQSGSFVIARFIAWA